MKQDTTGWFDLTLLFNLIKKFVLKQSGNQYKTAVLIAEQLSILLFRHDDKVQIGNANATNFDHFTTRVEVVHPGRAGVCYCSPELLEDKATQLNTGNYDNLSSSDKKKAIKVVKQEYLAYLYYRFHLQYLFLINSNVKMQSQLKKDVANDYSKGLSWKCCRFRCHQQLALKTYLRVFPTRRPDTANVSATSCDVGFFFLCRMSCRYLIADMSW
jgi:hypothetical protein